MGPYPRPLEQIDPGKSRRSATLFHQGSDLFPIHGEIHFPWAPDGAAARKAVGPSPPFFETDQARWRGGSMLGRNAVSKPISGRKAQTAKTNSMLV